MVVERHVDLLFVDGIEQRFGVGNELSVPCVAVPILQTVVPRARGSVVGVPPHVEDDVVEREIVAVLAPYYVEEIIGRVGPIAKKTHPMELFSCHGDVSAAGSE